ATPEGGASPLSGDEEALWRDLIRIVVTLPRALDDDLARMAGISLSEYAVLMNLSEAEGQGLRLSALAAAVALSLSRVSRLVDELQAQGLVTKARDAVDTRGSIATLTPAGLDRLRRAYPAHLLSARQRVMDHVPAELVLPTTRALAAVAATMR
ncbi:MAG TPA: MarR family winged helix-turn-helix transcriptional regulator, partial [Streptosporangiaceae bacterium]|nr:MarR family winged helix-turn-helix transcriptional regulator [Streptosporangiaceae bacterium]